MPSDFGKKNEIETYNDIQSNLLLIQLNKISS